MTGGAGSSRAALLRALALAAAALALAAAAWAAWDQDWTYDEHVHLLWSERLLQGETDRSSNRRFESKTPVSVVNVLARRAAHAAGVDGERRLRFAARAPQLVWLTLLFVALRRFAAVRFGAAAGWLALLLVALDPNFAAHSSVVTVDLPYAVATLLVVWGAVRYAECPGTARAAWLGAAVGLALATKFSALLLVAGLAALPVAFSRRLARAARIAVHAAVAAAATCAAVSAAYLFTGVGARLAQLTLRSGLGDLPGALKALPLPLPEAFLTGLDLSMAIEDTFPWDVVLLDRSHPEGVWYYFAVLWLIKTPLPLLAGQLAGIGAALRDGRLLRAPALRFVALQAAASLVFFSFFFRAQIGYRFVLMVLPLAALIAAAGLAPLLDRRRAGALLTAGVAFAAAENVFYWGDPLAFSNAAIWPKREVFLLMADSNVAWGQNRARVRELIERDRVVTRVDPIHPLPGHNTFNVNALAGVGRSRERHRWLRENAAPGGLLTHSFVWFDVSNEQYDRFMADERSYPDNRTAPALCDALPERVRYGPRDRVRFSRNRPPAAGARTLVCTETNNPGELGFRVDEGHARIGVVDASGACETLLVEAGEIAWHRLLPGRHALCIEEIPNRRAYLPYSLDATFVIRRHGVSLAIEPPAPQAGPAP